MSQQNWNEISKSIDTIEGLYQAEVEELVKQVMDEVKESDSVNSAADLNRYIEETVQGSDWVQATRKIRVVLFASENRDEYANNDRGASEACKAAYALHVDVREGVDEALQELGASLTSPWRCKECVVRYTHRDLAAECCAEDEEEAE